MKKFNRKSLLTNTLAFSIGFGLFGCSVLPEPDSSVSSIETSDVESAGGTLLQQILDSRSLPEIEGFKLVRSPGGGALYVTEAKDIPAEAYDDWLLLDPVIEFSRRQTRLTPTERASLQQIVHDANLQRNKMLGITSVGAPSNCTLSCQMRLIDLRLYKSGASSSQINYVRSLGNSEVVIDLRDSTSNRLIMLYVTRIELGGGVTKSASPDLNRLSQSIIRAMDTATQDMGFAIEPSDENIEARNAFGCSGAIGSNWRRLVEAPI